MQITEDLKKYLRNGFIDDVLSKTSRPNIKMTSECVWGKFIRLPFYHDGKYDTETFELENWYIHRDISKINTIEELINIFSQEISEEECNRLYLVDPYGEHEDTVVCHQLCDWVVLTGEDNDPLRGNSLTIVKYAKFINMEKYGLKEEEQLECSDSSLMGKICVNESPTVTESFSNPSLEEAYKQGIKDALDWLTEPANRDTYSNEYGERTYYFVYESEIDNFAKAKGIKCKIKKEK